MAKIFISYRTKDASGHAQGIHDFLASKFGAKAAFLDKRDIKVGTDWEETLTRSGDSARALIVLIGPNWLEGNEERLHNENDWVRKEIESGLDKNLTMIPVLVDGASMPSEDQLPDSIKRMTKIQSHHLRNESYDADLRLLEQQVSEVIESKPQQIWRKHKKAIITLLVLLLLGFIGWWVYIAMQPTFECPDFPAESDINSLVIPTSDQKTANELDAMFDQEMRNYLVKPATMVLSISSNFSDIDLEEDIERMCDADVLLRPIGELSTNPEVRFRLANEELKSYDITEDLKLEKKKKIIHPDNKDQLSDDLKSAVCYICLFVNRQNENQDLLEKTIRSCNLNDMEEGNKVVAKQIIADNFIEQNQFEQAAEYLDYMTDDNGINVQNQRKTAYVYEKLGWNEKNINTYSKLLEIDPENQVKYLEERGKTYEKLEQYGEAKSDYKEVEKIEPDNKVIKRRINELEIKEKSRIQVNLYSPRTMRKQSKEIAAYFDDKNVKVNITEARTTGNTELTKIALQFYDEKNEKRATSYAKDLQEITGMTTEAKMGRARSEDQRNTLDIGFTTDKQMTY